MEPLFLFVPGPPGRGGEGGREGREGGEGRGGEVAAGPVSVFQDPH